MQVQCQYALKQNFMIEFENLLENRDFCAVYPISKLLG